MTGQMSDNPTRGRIVHIGEIRRQDNGEAQIYGWQFEGDNRPGLIGARYDEAGELASVCGWSPAELHTIAHGHPCLFPHCPLAVSP